MMGCRTMTLKEVAVYLGLHWDTVYGLVREKKIPNFKIGCKIFFCQKCQRAGRKSSFNVLNSMLMKLTVLSKQRLVNARKLFVEK